MGAPARESRIRSHYVLMTVALPHPAAGRPGCAAPRGGASAGRMGGRTADLPHQPVAGAFQVALQPDPGTPVRAEAGRNRLQEFHSDVAGILAQRPPAPEYGRSSAPSARTGRPSCSYIAKDADAVGPPGAGRHAGALVERSRSAGRRRIPVAPSSPCPGSPSTGRRGRPGSRRPCAPYHPQIGIDSNSRLSTGAGSSTSRWSFMVSQADWCLAARMNGPPGSRSRPLTS